LFRYEVENKQLHQVIAQLRQVRKTSKGESDNAIAERDELRAQCTALQGEVAMLQDSLRAFTANDATVAQLREDMSQIAARLAATERTLESTRRSLAQREKECYDKDAELEVTRSDMLIARQDLERKIVEVANLQEAVSQIESEKNFAVSRYQRDLAERTSAFKMQAEQEKSRIEGELRRQLEEEHARRVQLEASTQEYELFYRKADMEFNKEKKKMQRTLENALAQLSNSQAQVIDRMLVANLIVSYFKRRRYAVVPTFPNALQTSDCLNSHSVTRMGLPD
jgi:chromosome segregation ATPase